MSGVPLPPLCRHGFLRLHVRLVLWAGGEEAVDAAAPPMDTADSTTGLPETTQGGYALAWAGPGHTR